VLDGLRLSPWRSDEGAHVFEPLPPLLPVIAVQNERVSPWHVGVRRVSVKGESRSGRMSARPSASRTETH
jgi:hypothetical protein